MTQYKYHHINHLYEHDILFDQAIPNRLKNTYRYQFDDIFMDKPVLHFSVRGLHSIAKLNSMFGPKEIHFTPNKGSLKFGLHHQSRKEKESLR